MRAFVRMTVVLVACLAQVACTSFRVVADGQTASVSALRSAEPPLAPKDAAVITTTDGRTVALQVTAVDAAAITGTVDGSLAPVVIPTQEIQRIERNELDGGKVLRNVLLYIAVGLVIGYVVGNAIVGRAATVSH